MLAYLLAKRFFNPKRIDQYSVYVWDSTYTDQVKPNFSKKNVGETASVYMQFDSSFHPLLEYLNRLQIEKIVIQDVRSLSKPNVKIGLVKGLTGKLPDNVLGYLQISPVIVNKSKDKGVFFYKLIGTYSKSWVVSVNKRSGKWTIVNQYILGTS